MLNFGYKVRETKLVTSIKEGENMNTDKTIFDYDKLRGRIKEYFKTEGKFSEELGISSVQLSNLLNNKAVWDQILINKACMLLKILSIEIPVYFFTEKV